MRRVPESPRIPSSATSTPARSRLVRTTARPVDTPRRRRASNAGTTVTVRSMARRMLLSSWAASRMPAAMMTKAAVPMRRR